MGNHPTDQIEDVINGLVDALKNGRVEVMEPTKPEPLMWTVVTPCGACGQPRYSTLHEPEVEALRDPTLLLRGPRSTGRALLPAFESDEATAKQERIVAIYLDGSGYRLTGPEVVAVGGLDSCVLDKRVILGRALRLGAVGIIIAHNHPSGALLPSSRDTQATMDLRKAAALVEIDIVDHLIIGPDRRVYSMRTEKCYQIQPHQQDATILPTAADLANGRTPAWSEG